MRNEAELATAIPRVPALDGLRGIAILLVLALHFGAVAGFAGAGDSWAGRLVERVCYAGWAGVDLFFVLSGFLISSVLLASTDRPDYYRNFYGRRALRIFPLYFGTLIVGLGLLPRIMALPPTFIGDARYHSIWLWTYTTNIALAFGLVPTFGVFDLYWTLAIEEQFYLVWPFVIRSLRVRTLALVCVAAAAGALVCRLWWIGSDGTWPGAYRFTLARIDQLAVGALVAVLVRHPTARTAAIRLVPAVLAGVVLVLMVMFVQIDPFYPSADAVITAGHSVLAIFFGCLVFCAATAPHSRLTTSLSTRWLRTCGMISYGVYVWHWPLRLVLDEVYRGLTPPSSASGQLLRASTFLGIGVVGALILGWLSYHLYEKHFLHLKSRFTYAAPARSTRSTTPPS